MFAFISVSPFLVPDPQKLTLIFEGRERYNRRTTKTFSDAVNDGTTLFEQRYRVGFGFKQSPKVDGRAIYQYAHTETWSKARNFSTEASDLYVGEVNLHQPEGVYTLGRQILKIGGQRLFEESQFGQRSKSFDLVRFRGHNLDLWAGKVGYSPVLRDRARIVGGTYDSPLGQTLIAFKHDQWVFHQDFWTFDQRYAKTIAGIDVELEGALQRGRVSGKDLQAHFLHARVGKGFGKQWGTYVDFTQGSGGNSGNTTHDFDILYGATHSFYGRADDTGPRNLNDLEVGVTYKPAPGREFGITYNKFALYDPKDAWYGTGLSANSRPGGKFIDPTGKSGRDIGQEFDVLGRFDLSKRAYVATELASFQPGNFIKAFNGSHTKNQFWGIVYLMYKY